MTVVAYAALSINKSI